MTKPRTSKFYENLAYKIETILGSYFPKIKFEKAGSRAKNAFRRESDLDIRFYYPGHKKEEIYPKIIEILKKKLPSLNGERIKYEIGRDYNVIKILPENGGKIDLVLVS